MKKLWPACLGLALGSCAMQPSFTGPSPFDGTYVGAAQLVGYSAPDWHCDWTPDPITIRDGQFHSDIDGAPMTVNIAPNGTFAKLAARPIYRQTRFDTPMHIQGRVEQGVLQARVHEPRCTFNLVMRRAGPAQP